MRAAACVHEDDPALELRAGGGHRVVPKQAADIVDDLGASGDGGPRGDGVVGVDGEKRIALRRENGCDDRHDAIDLLLSG